MREINNILVVCKLLRNLKIAVRYGSSLARRFGGSLTVIHVVEDPYGGIESSNLPLPDLDEDYQSLVKNSREQIDKIIAGERENGVEIEVLIREGKPSEEILAAIKERDIDLLVMTAHKEGWIEHFLSDSYDKLIREMPCHILLVKIEPIPELYLHED